MRLPEPALSRAVLVGVDDYRFLDGLPAVGAGLDALRALLTDPTVWGLPEDCCTVLHNPPSAEAVLDAVHEAASAAEDAFVVYFAGHGLLSPNAELYLALTDSRTERLYKAVGYDLIRHELMDTCAAPSRVVLLDCCYSGRALAAHMGTGGPGGMPQSAGIDGTYLMTASAGTKLAWAPPGETYTAFTGELVAALRDGVPGAPELLGMDVLFRQVHAELTAKGRPAPQQLARNAGHTIALARNRRPPGGDPRPRAAAPNLPETTHSPEAPHLAETHLARSPHPPSPAGPPAGGPSPQGANGGSRRTGRSMLRRLAARRPRLPAAGASAVALIALVAQCAPPSGDGRGAGADGPRAAGAASPRPGGARSAVGEHRTADPCALSDPAVLGRFGTARLDRDYGNFDRCDVLVDTGDATPVDVMVHFDHGGLSELSVSKETRGSVTVVDEGDAEDGRCRRTLVPAGDEVNITIVAKQRDGGAPLCAMAEAAADRAAEVLDRGVIRRRTPQPPEASLVHEDACTLLTPDRLAVVPGVDARAFDVGFGNWDCRWASTTADLWVELRFDRGQPPTGQEGALTRIGGRSAVVQPDGEGPGTCLVRVVHRSYTDQEGNTAVETVNLTVGGDLAPQRLQRMARQLAASALTRLMPS